MLIQFKKTTGGKRLKFKSAADPLFDTLGHASLSYPGEYKGILSSLKQYGVEIKL